MTNDKRELRVRAAIAENLITVYVITLNSATALIPESQLSVFFAAMLTVMIIGTAARLWSIYQTLNTPPTPETHRK